MSRIDTGEKKVHVVVMSSSKSAPHTGDSNLQASSLSLSVSVVSLSLLLNMN